MKHPHAVAGSFRYQNFMTKKDWTLLLTLSVVSSFVWSWVAIAAQPAIDESSWVTAHVNTSITEVPINHAPSLE